MQVILLEQVKKLGNIGDVVEVKGGYGRNFLILNNKALRATKDNIAYFETQKAEIEKANKAKLAEAEKQVKAIDDKVVVLIQQAGEDGRLYGSVGAANIATSVTEQLKQEISRKQIELHDPIKYIGVHTVEIALHGEVTANVHVNIARSEDEAKDAGERFARGETVMEGPSASEETAEEEATEVAVEESTEAESAEAAAEETPAEEAKAEEAPAEAKSEEPSE